MDARMGLAALVAVALAGSTGVGMAPGQQRRATIHDLSLEVAALQSLYDFRFTPNQLELLARLAPDTREDDRPRTRVRVTDAFEKALADLRQALADPVNAERIGKALDVYSKIHEKEDPDLDDQVEITDKAKEKAPEILRSMSARQVAAFLAGFGEDFPDPFEDLKEAMGKVRKLEDDHWKVLRRVVGQSIGDQAAGLDAEKAALISDEVVQILIQARSLDDKAFERERPNLEKKAQDLFKNIGPVEVIRNTTEVALATLLSNPRLGAALQARKNVSVSNKDEAQGRRKK